MPAGPHDRPSIDPPRPLPRAGGRVGRPRLMFPTAGTLPEVPPNEAAGRDTQYKRRPRPTGWTVEQGLDKTGRGRR